MLNIMNMITVVTKNNPLYKESNMTKQINELIEFLGENGIRVAPTFKRYPEKDQLKILNKMI